MIMVRGYAALTGRSAPGNEVDPGEARNGFVHLASLILTKTGDGIVDPKLVLTWTLSVLGASGAMIGALVPIREAGALLPQGLLARHVQAARRRRLFWSAGAALQGIAAIGMAVAASLLHGAAAGWAILLCLAAFSVARSACSVSFKDVLARTIPKTRRGALTGAAGTVASALVLAFAAALATGYLPLSTQTIAAALAAAGLAWLTAALLFLRLEEQADDDQTGEGETSLVVPLLENAQLRRFIFTRALLVSTALAPPFLIIASGTAQGGALGVLGPLMIASATASIVSAWIWGRLSDRSSRLSLTASAALAAVVFAAASGAAFSTGGPIGTVGTALAVFVARIAHEGVRSSRKLHLTDMASDNERARFTAVANTVIGGVLLLGGGLGIVSDLFGPAVVLGLLAIFSALAVPVALGLEEVQRT